jgi:hypothetical protein
MSRNLGTTKLTPRWRLLALSPGVVLTASLAGCGAFGQGVTGTDHIVTSENAVNTVVGSIRIDDVYVTVSGRTVVQRLTLTNGGQTADRLASIAGAGATPAQLSVALAPGQTVDLDVGPGLVLPVSGATPKPGDDLAVTLHLAGTGDAYLTVPVVAPSQA